jgi:16S rRNA pseudouridine516 synthase
LKNGVLLHDENETLKAVDARVLSDVGENVLELTLREGKYHQVKRMVAAAGNHVEKLHRVRVGEFSLPANLPVGEWVFLELD